MAKWNASVGLQLSIDYDDIEADTREEADQIGVRSGNCHRNSK